MLGILADSVQDREKRTAVVTQVEAGGKPFSTAPRRQGAYLSSEHSLVRLRTPNAP